MVVDSLVITTVFGAGRALVLGRAGALTLPTVNVGLPLNVDWGPTIKAHFDSAFMTTKVDSDGDLYVKDQSIGTFVRLTQSKKMLRKSGVLA